MPARNVSVLDTLPPAVAKVFDQAQSSTANHQKNFVVLYKLHVEAATFKESIESGVRLTGERVFGDRFIEMINHVLTIKKGITVADRIVKFVGGYIKFIHAKTKREDGDEEDDESVVSRFTARLLTHLLKGFLAKDKNVRYRVSHFVADMISHLGELEEDMYTSLRTSLMERVRDKEPTIRVQAVIALSKLCGSEDPDELEDDEATAIDVLEDMLAHDPSADVRRAALLNIPLSPATIPSLLTRTRDIDTTIRKLVYSAILEPNCFVVGTEDIVGVTHPRALTIAQRELIVRNGLGDRETAVRAAAGKLVGTWVDAVGSGKGSITEDVIAFLQTFDLAENTVAEEALLSVLVTRVDVFDGLEFEETFWDMLTPEKAFLARVFVDHCISTKDSVRLESVLPVVTELAFRIQHGYNDLLEQIQSDEEERFLRGGEGDDGDDDARMDREFIICELLKLAVNLDYADEIGRRKMFQLVRDMISQEALPENLVTRCLDILRKLSPNERDLIRVVVEVVHELRDPSDPDEDVLKDQEPSGADDASTSFAETPVPVRVARAPAAPKPVSEMTPEEKTRADALDVRCLDLCIGMLERVNGTFEENSTLEGILGELIVPAVKRKELALREKGLVSLGLCCLIARRMALNSFQLFLSQVQAAPEVLKIRVLQVVFDILMVHEGDFLANGHVGGDRVIEFLLHVLNNDESEKVQAIICMGFAKLMLSRMVTDNRVLSSLILVYLSPDTADNQELRQCLSYFFPVYCYSSPANQRRMQQVFPSIFEQLATAYKALDDDQEMVSPAQVGGMFVDWTDPQKAVEIQGQTPDPSIHIDMASDIVKALFNKQTEKEEKKVLCQLLGKMYIPPEIDDDKIRTLKLLIHNLRLRRPLRDTASNNALNRFDASISKKYEKQLEDFNEEEYRQLESLKELFEFLDDVFPEDDEEDEMPPKKRTRKRRSDSIISDATETSQEERSATPTRKRGQGRAKRRRFEGSDEEEEVRAVSPPTSAAPTRSMPKRAATKKVDMAPLKLPDSEEDEDEDEDVEQATPVPPQRHRNTVGSRGKPNGHKKSVEEQQLDEDIDDLLDDDVPQDSVVDSEEEEVEEVDGLLGSDG